jgi:two-component system CheB/CheR fusion protein
MSPTDQSALVALLGRITVLRVLEATDGAALEPDTVFVAPPGVDVVVTGTALGLVQPDDRHRPWPSIDRLFTSAADTLGDECVGIVLSGTGDDGTAGVEAIKGAGGVVIVQDQATAAFGAMPGAAYATGSVDLQLAPDTIPAALERILAAGTGTAVGDVPTPGVEDAAAVGGSPGLDNAGVEAVIVALRSATGVDYAGYKRSTLRRQIERRLRIVNRTPAEYVGMLGRDAAEAEALTRGILVTVTAFFRDRPVWDALAGHLRALVDTLDPIRPLRLWVPGCASGEEAYTVAMLAAEALGPSQDDLVSRMKVFATDLDDRSLAVARRARYPRAGVEAVPDELRDRWMQPVDGDWEVVPSLRECVVIARHNVAFDPPFPRLHLISLRNTLIYFQPHLQDRVLQLCQFALVPDGLLVLGKSERLPHAGFLFSVVEPGYHIYRRRYSARAVTVPAGRYAATAAVAATPRALAVDDDHGVLPYRRLLQALAAPSLVLDEHDSLIEVIGDVSPWCLVAAGSYTGHVVELLREPYRPVVRAMLSQLRHSSIDTVLRQAAGPDGPVEFSVTRFVSGAVSAVVSFRVPAAGAAGADAPVDAAEFHVRKELESAQEALQATVDDLSNSNEELQALNEELQASTEELQATSEEAQASNEELEAANEELTTLNQELQARGVELVSANTDLENIQASLTSGLVIVDRELRVLRYSPLAVRVFSLIAEDTGRPLPAVPTTIAIPTLAEDLRDVMVSRATRIIELDDGTRDFLLQIQPYAASSGEVLGAMVVVIDVSDIAQARRERELAFANLQTVTESVRELVWQRDSSGALTLLTKRVEDIYGLDRDRVLADPSLLTAAVHPADRDRVAAARASADRRWQIEYRIVRPDGTIRWVDESAEYTDVGVGGAASFTGSVLDSTDRHQLQAAAARRGAVLDALLATRTVGVVVLDSEDRIMQVSDSVAAISGYPSATLVGRPLSGFLQPDPARVSRSASTVPDDLGAHRILTVDGTYRPVTMELLPVESTDAGNEAFGGVPGRVAVVHDATRLREISADLAAREQFDQQTGLLTRTYFRSRTEELIAANTAGLAVLWIDLDGFKEVNDRLGHSFGDVVLTTIATRLQRAARRRDVVGRLGGDEFALLITRVEDLDEIEKLVDRLLLVVREPIGFQGTLAYVSASMGIALHPQDGGTADELLHNADIAMYAAKQRGGDRHAYFAREMNDTADARSQQRHDLALAVRNRDFELHYQPVFEVPTKRLAYVEALLRWRHGDHVVTAENFIERAVETGQLRAISRIVLELLDADMHALHDRFGERQPRVSVNLSARELEDRDTRDWFIAWNPAGGFDRLIAEVTESVPFTPTGRAMETLALLRRLGMTISVDDFGTGYSNLELLDRIKPAIIKIDKSLLRRSGGAEEPVDKILNAANQLARALGAQVVVEGVADEPRWRIACALGAELAQGFFLAEAMPLAALMEWITADGRDRAP